MVEPAKLSDFSAANLNIRQDEWMFVDFPSNGPGIDLAIKLPTDSRVSYAAPENVIDPAKLLTLAQRAASLPEYSWTQSLQNTFGVRISIQPDAAVGAGRLRVSPSTGDSVIVERSIPLSELSEKVVARLIAGALNVSNPITPRHIITPGVRAKLESNNSRFDEEHLRIVTTVLTNTDPQQAPSVTENYFTFGGTDINSPDNSAFVIFDSDEFGANLIAAYYEEANGDAVQMYINLKTGSIKVFNPDGTTTIQKLQPPPTQQPTDALPQGPLLNRK